MRDPMLDVIEKHLVYIVNMLRNGVPLRLIQQVTGANKELVERIAHDANLEVTYETY